MKQEIPEISQEAMSLLVRYDFPGNVRELQNVLERASLLCCWGESSGSSPRIDAEHLPRELVGSDEEASDQSLLKSHERAMIVDALRRSGWNQTQAAKALGITRDSIRYRIKKHRIEPPG